METTIAVFNQISLRIIREQENIIGSLAWDEAAKVPGLSVIDRSSRRFDCGNTRQRAP